jgi:hypothetical protein
LEDALLRDDLFEKAIAHGNILFGMKFVYLRGYIFGNDSLEIHGVYSQAGGAIEAPCEGTNSALLIIPGYVKI